MRWLVVTSIVFTSILTACTPNPHLTSPTSPANAHTSPSGAISSNKNSSALLDIEDVNRLARKSADVTFDRQSNPLSNPNSDEDVYSETAGCAEVLQSEGKSIYGNNLVNYRELKYSGIISPSYGTGEGFQFPAITQTAGFYTDDNAALQAFDRLSRALRSCGNTSGKATWGQKNQLDFTLTLGDISDSFADWHFDLRGGAGKTGNYAVEAFVAKNALIQVKGSDLGQNNALIPDVSDAIKLRLNN